MDNMDNAGVYRLREDLALIQTIDFFTPIVDDPYDFGQIAAANSLSDVYTMGGKPLTALNVVCFPNEQMDLSILKEVLAGGAAKMKEAGVILIGGHSISDKEMKYGLAVTGIIDPRFLITNAGAMAGDILILTKPLGTGIISTAMKANKTTKSLIKTVTSNMAMLNAKASELMLQCHTHACTDITGFGLIGHMTQMAENSGVGMSIDSLALPFYEEAKKFARQGFCPGGLQRNREFYGKGVQLSGIHDEFTSDIIYDPQTSGGLLISVLARDSAKLLNGLLKAGYKDASIIGNVIKGSPGKIFVD
jgi:selenide,water dikinase